MYQCFVSLPQIKSYVGRVCGKKYAIFEEYRKFKSIKISLKKADLSRESGSGTRSVRSYEDLLDFDNEQRDQEKPQVQDQQSYKIISKAHLTCPPSNWKHQPTQNNSIACKAKCCVYIEIQKTTSCNSNLMERNQTPIFLETVQQYRQCKSHNRKSLNFSEDDFIINFRTIYSHNNTKESIQTIK